MGNTAKKLCCSCLLPSDFDDDQTELIVRYTKKQIVEIITITNDTISHKISNESILTQSDDSGLEISLVKSDISQLSNVNKILAQIPLDINENLLNDSQNLSQNLTRSIIDYLSLKFLLPKPKKLKQKKLKNTSLNVNHDKHQSKEQSKASFTLGISPLCELFFRLTDINFI